MENIDLTLFKTLDTVTIFHLKEEEMICYYEKINLFFNGICLECGTSMSKWNDISKDFTKQKFHCKECELKLNKRFGTIFENMRINFVTFNHILHYYTEGFTSLDIYSLIRPLTIKQISLTTIRKYTKLFRKIGHIHLQEYLSDTILPGPVEIDEACIYKIKRGKHGRMAHIIFWVFGMKCRTTKKTIIYPIAGRSREQIIPLIQKHIPSGTVIYSDRFSCYWNNRANPPQSYLETLGYIHFGVNHSKEFVSSVNSTIHTNTIERVWKALKLKFRNYKPRKYIQEFISEFMIDCIIPREDRYYFYLFLLNKYHHIN